MAQQTINIPAHASMPANTGDSSERGDSIFAMYTKVQAMFTELYTLLTGITAPELGYVDGVTAGAATASKALVLDANKGISAFRNTGVNLYKQVAPTAMTTAATMTSAAIMSGLITAQGGAAVNYQFPLGTDLEAALIAAFPGLANDDSFDFTIVNIDGTGANAVTVTTNTNITLVGDMTVAGITVGDQSCGTFRVRRTAANTYSVYRL